MADLSKARISLAVHAELFVWLAVHGNLCLALRHPSNRGASRRHVQHFIRQLGRRLVDEGILSPQELQDAEKLEIQEGSLTNEEDA